MNQDPQQQPQQPSQPQPAAAPQVQREDPGKTLGIVSIVLDFVGFALIGIVLGVMSKKKSKEAGFDGSLGNIGMIIGIVFVVLNIVILGAISIVAYNGIQERTLESQRQSEQNQLEKQQLNPL